MRTHIQGIAILGFLLVALWGMTQLATPTLGNAFGEDGAVNAESADDTIELTIDTATLDADLTGDELRRLQFQLLRAGFLTEQSDVDGDRGPITASAIADAAAEWGLTDASDRAVLEHADELFADKPFIGTP